MSLPRNELNMIIMLSVDNVVFLDSQATDTGWSNFPKISCR